MSTHQTQNITFATLSVKVTNIVKFTVDHHHYVSTQPINQNRKKNTHLRRTERPKFKTQVVKTPLFDVSCQWRHSRTGHQARTTWHNAAWVPTKHCCQMSVINQSLWLLRGKNKHSFCRRDLGNDDWTQVFLCFSACLYEGLDNLFFIR